MPKTTVERRYDPTSGELLSRLITGSSKASSWRYGLYTIEDLAQDQAIIRFDRGRGIETYQGILKGIDEDAQSDLARRFAADRIVTVNFDVLLQEAFKQVALAWHSDETMASDEPEVLSPKVHAHAGVSLADGSDTTRRADCLARALLESDAENDWSRLRELILLAEDTGFTPQQCEQLAPRLLALAIGGRDSDEPEDEPVVWSAIRTGASMLRPHEAKHLVPLLEPNHPIETSVVALKMLGRIFEAQPPEKVDQYSEPARHVREISKSLLNHYALASSQSAATAQLAVYALAAMASNQTLKVVRSVRELGLTWFTQQTHRELCELRGYWTNRSPMAPADVCKLLERAIRKLDGN